MQCSPHANNPTSDMLWHPNRYSYSAEQERAFPGIPSLESNLRKNQYGHFFLSPLWMGPPAPVPQRPVGLTGAAAAANPWAPGVYVW